MNYLPIQKTYNHHTDHTTVVDLFQLVISRLVVQIY